ncbi:hypothetical protein ACHAWF_016061 [Thalassiosira exigua]
MEPEHLELAENSDHNVEIDKLRGRLNRRNALLDVIRKAYHRDVLVVKECLADAQNQGLIGNANDANSVLGSSLAFVPSVDLRETFCLFAPQECELRVRSCWHCGGQLEVIHRESARIVNFKHSILQLQEKENDIRMELVRTKVKAQDDRDKLMEVTKRSKDERDVLLGQILSLKCQVSDRNALEEEVRRLQADKENLESIVEQHRPILADHERLVVEIKEVKEDAAQWQARYREQVAQNRKLENDNDLQAQQLLGAQREKEQLQGALQEAKNQFEKSSDQCSHLAEELSKSQAASEEIQVCLHKAERAIDELEAEFGLEKQQMDNRICDLTSKYSESRAKISYLQNESRKNAGEADNYRKRIEATFEGARRRGSIAVVPQNSDAAFAKTDELFRELESLRHKAAILFNLLLSCIRSTYENCLVQERLLVDNGSELHRNERKLKQSLEPTNDKARMVLEHLGNTNESDVIEWASILANDTDQRHILGNLQNRLQMGQFSLDRAFQKIYKDHATEMQRCEREHHKQIEERRSRIWELEKMLTDAISVNRKYEDKMLKMREGFDAVEPAIDSLRFILRKMRRDCLSNNDEISKLKVDFQQMRMLVARILDDLRASRETILTQKEDLNEKHDDILNRDAAIEQLEQLLERITHKYAENERLRIKVTQEVAIQAVPEIADMASHADFLPTSARGALSAMPVNNKSSGALLPGRIFNLTDENWPSRINVRPINLRQAIDKL